MAPFTNGFVPQIEQKPTE